MISVEVVYALPERQFAWALELPDGATVGDALAQVAAAPELAAIDLQAAAVGIYGEVVARDHVLGDTDRVEIYRPLVMDPKEARRLRAANRLD